MALEMGFADIFAKIKLPDWLLLPVAYVCNVIGWVLGKKLKINPFNVRVLTMHRWFAIDDAVSDLGFSPIIGFREGWKDTADYFKRTWLPKFNEGRGSGGLMGHIATQSQE